MDESEYWDARNYDADQLHTLNMNTAELKQDYWRMKIRKLKEGE
ncbi:MAG: hypothetical protein ABIC57_00915 [bacterium]